MTAETRQEGDPPEATSVRLLLVDDDRELAGMLGEYLEPEGFTVDWSGDGQSALDRLRESVFDLVILDVMMPGMNGLEVLRRLRADDHTPVLMLTARGDDVDRIVGLEIGADDYLPKPFNPRELVARLRAILRRTRPGDDSRPMRAGRIIVDPSARTATSAGRSLTLTGTEFELLRCLVSTAGEVVSKEVLSREVLGRRLMPWDRSVDTHVSNLRRKLMAEERDGAGDNPIRNVRGVGYVLVAGDADA
ncbi:MAG: response regulator transcription factor [Gammaproteobacteria bacterium]|jgi:two-component system response regulator CpxR